MLLVPPRHCALTHTCACTHRRMHTHAHTHTWSQTVVYYAFCLLPQYIAHSRTLVLAHIDACTHTHIHTHGHKQLCVMLSACYPNTLRTHAHLCLHTQTHAHTHTHTHTHTRTHTWSQTVVCYAFCLSPQYIAHSRTLVLAHTHACTHTYTRAHTHTHSHTRIHTHIHTHTWSQTVVCYAFCVAGVLLVTPEFNLVVVEGCGKAQKRYAKLMLRRIDWSLPAPKQV